MPLLSVITTCKGRLEHLRASLPTLMALEDCEVIVVDYDCPDGAGAWVRSAWPAARVVSVADAPLFNVARARNLGVAAATADWLLLTDADVLVAPRLVEALRGRLAAGVFLRPDSGVAQLGGVLVAARADLAAIGGYDAVFEGWGSEDLDVVARLERHGLRAATFPGGLLTSLAHDDAARGRFHQVADLGVNLLINALYRHVKMDLLALRGELDEAARRAIYDQIRRAALSPEGPRTVEVSFREASLAGRGVVTSLRYVVRPEA